MPKTRVNGIELHYEQHGEGDVVVLVHGLGTSSADWQFQYPALSAHYRVIAPCLRGFGQSERPPGPYSIAQFADDIRALLDGLAIERCHMAGVSMGGAIGFQFAVDNPQRLRSLVAINSQPSFELDTWKKKLMVATRYLMVRTIGLERLARFRARRNFPGAANAGLRQRVAGRYRNDKHSYLAALDAIVGWNVDDRLDALGLPVLFVTGEHDYTSPQEKARFAARLARATVEIIPDGHHAVHLGNPERVNDLLLSFLRGVEGQR